MTLSVRAPIIPATTFRPSGETKTLCTPPAVGMNRTFSIAAVSITSTPAPAPVIAT